jgi:hypothetical protein
MRSALSASDRAAAAVDATKGAAIPRPPTTPFFSSVANALVAASSAASSKKLCRKTFFQAFRASGSEAPSSVKLVEFLDTGGRFLDEPADSVRVALVRNLHSVRVDCGVLGPTGEYPKRLPERLIVTACDWNIGLYEQRGGN